MPEPTQRSWRDPVPHRLWILLGLCVVLTAIGFVEFRWIDEVARAQREHAVAALHASVTRFASDFDTELARIHFTFQIPMPARGMDVDAAVQYRLRKWRELAPYPRLISQVQVKMVEPDRSHADSIFSAGIPPLPGRVVIQNRLGVGPVESKDVHGQVIFRTSGPPLPGGIAFRTAGGPGLSI